MTTQWTPCSEIVGGVLPIWRACRTVDGIHETDISIYGTQGDALHRAHELNAKEKRPHRRQPIRTHKDKPICCDCITEQEEKQ